MGREEGARQEALAVPSPLRFVDGRFVGRQLQEHLPEVSDDRSGDPVRLRRIGLAIGQHSTTHHTTKTTQPKPTQTNPNQLNANQASKKLTNGQHNDDDWTTQQCSNAAMNVLTIEQ